MTSNDQPSRWKVVSQRQTIDQQADGSIGQVVEVTFALADGTVGKVSVPVRGFNAQAVTDRINAYADHLDAVSRLEG